MYQNLVAEQDESAPESVHLCAYPVADESRIDRALEARMKEVLAVTVLGRSARNAASVKNRQPIGRMFVKADEALPAFFCDIIKGELNVKEVVFTDSLSQFTTYTFKPQLRTVGPKYGKILGGIRTALDALDGNAAMAELEEKGVLTLTVGDTVAELSRDDLLIEMVKQAGFETVSDRGVTVVLDTTLPPELIEEGYVNELVSKIQTMRKESGFEVTDRIHVTLGGNAKLAAIMQKNEAEIGRIVLAESFTYAEAVDGKAWTINDEKATILLKKA
jgi:isoleucyl-tRNA synthetase